MAGPLLSASTRQLPFAAVHVKKSSVQRIPREYLFKIKITVHNEPNLWYKNHTMKAIELFRQKLILKHSDNNRLGVFEVVIWRVGVTVYYPEGVKYRAWLSENGKTIFGFDNHKPKGPHLHIGELEIGYVYRGKTELFKDVLAMIKKEGFIYEDK
jgi:hypothetical protein